MRNNPFSTGSEEGNRMTNPADSNNPINQPFTFASPPRTPVQVGPEMTMIQVQTVSSLKSLLGNIAETFREHGMVDLAAEAEKVADLL
tara:strand:+ start:121 stop:384 length:264 start_codon:yes stop_codon:yes gene_type:complete